jgi:hypothetical protein
MKTNILSIVLLAFFHFATAQNDYNSLNKGITELEDKLAIKNLVDTFSILADQSKAEDQTLLFTEDATVETFINGNRVSSLKGRKQIGETFANFLKTFITVYHINGQQSVAINGNKASGTSYFAVTLIGEENGKKIKTSIGVIYNDEYLKQSNRWFIAKRKSTFVWQDKQDLIN